MKKLLVGLLAVASVSTFANCKIEINQEFISELSYGLGGSSSISSITKKLRRKGYSVRASKMVTRNYRDVLVFVANDFEGEAEDMILDGSYDAIDAGTARTGSKVTSVGKVVIKDVVTGETLHNDKKESYREGSFISTSIDTFRMNTILAPNHLKHLISRIPPCRSI